MNKSTRNLGRLDQKISTIGLGCMGLSEFYGPPTDEKTAISMLHQAIDLGVNHFDTAESYGIGSANEKLLGRAFSDRRDKVVIATKFGPLRDPATGAPVGLDGSRKNCHRAIDASLTRLNTDYVDLFYLHRVDPQTPIEETVSAMAELIQAGKVRAIGLSEAAGETIRRAAKIHPVSAVQSEYSIFSRDIEDEVLPAIEEIGATLVAYSPLGRGILSGQFGRDKKMADNDFRQIMQPRYEGDAYQSNLSLVEEISRLAVLKNATTAQVALAWVIAKGSNIVTIPGTTRIENLKVNFAATALEMSPQEMIQLDVLAKKVQGTRYNETQMSRLNG